MSERAIPWYLWCAVLASFTVAVGVHWDIAWHRSIGRDTFWSPPHMAIYLAAVLAALAAGSQILGATFGRGARVRGDGVRVLGFRGPIGAFIAAWGGIAMLTSAPFDDWWHNAYGLDVKILSPPHVVLALGIVAIHVGALILVLGRMNSATGQSRRRLMLAFLFVGGMLMIALMTLMMEHISRSSMHTAAFYTLVSPLAAFTIVAAGRGSGHRWGATIAAASYSLVLASLLWLMPLVPAQPKLGPVTIAVTHLVPPELPMLLVVPAFALDLLWARVGGWSLARTAVASGALFAAVFFVVQWPFATFLMSPAARNWFFGAMYFDYNIPLRSLYYRYLFKPHEATAGAFIRGAAVTIAFTVAAAWIGLTWGRWMRRIRR
jgi:hypothetical protein